MSRDSTIVCFHQWRRTIPATNSGQVEYRKDLEDLVNCNGGQYRGNLTKDVTHLIAKVPSGNKYKYAMEWGIKVVGVEWLVQSLERGMILDETLYNLQLAASERGHNAWIRKSASTTSLGKRARDEDDAPRRSRKLRRTASAKLSSQNMGLWTDIVGGGTEVANKKTDEWDDQQRDHNLNGGIVRAESVGRDRTNGINKPRNLESPSFDQDTSDMKNKLIQPRPGQKEGLFQGKKFFLHGFNERQVCYIRVTGYCCKIPDIDIGRATSCTITCSPIKERLFKTLSSYSRHLPQVQVHIYWCPIKLPSMMFQGYHTGWYNQSLSRICGSNDVCIAKPSSNHNLVLQALLFCVFLLLVRFSHRSKLGS